MFCNSKICLNTKESTRDSDCMDKTVRREDTNHKPVNLYKTHVKLPYDDKTKTWACSFDDLLAEAVKGNTFVFTPENGIASVSVQPWEIPNRSSPLPGAISYDEETKRVFYIIRAAEIRIRGQTLLDAKKTYDFAFYQQKGRGLSGIASDDLKLEFRAVDENTLQLKVSLPVDAYYTDGGSDLPPNYKDDEDNKDDREKARDLSSYPDTSLHSELNKLTRNKGMLPIRLEDQIRANIEVLMPLVEGIIADTDKVTVEELKRVDG